LPFAISHSQAPMIAVMTTRPANDEARVSIAAQRSSRPGPARPASVSERRPPK